MKVPCKFKIKVVAPCVGELEDADQYVELAITHKSKQLETIQLEAKDDPKTEQRASLELQTSQCRSGRLEMEQKTLATHESRSRSRHRARNLAEERYDIYNSIGKDPPKPLLQELRTRNVITRRFPLATITVS